ncbi:MAG: selenocysteine lyase, partial [Flavobacteriaceae bacterium]|nr:selenocysteine lyase [Flavobacteriaceae bacterium]
LIVRLLNDRFGIQVRGGWSCASTYSHHLFDLSEDSSKQITEGITNKDLTIKPGWVRISLHPITTNQEVLFICDAIKQIADHIDNWKKGYSYNAKSNEFEYAKGDEKMIESIKEWFFLK